MTGKIADRLAEMGVSLPSPSAPAANYLPAVLHGTMMVVSGQLPIGPSGLAATGLVGRDLDLSAAQAAARLCAINVLAQAAAVLGGDLERVERLLRITVFVAGVPGFAEQHLVANGASDFFVAALGEAGRHARAAVGVASLPFNAAVEVDAIIAVR